ncbi:MAG: GNAT family N-acetyltransferase [Acutalibacteraceae bacterium]|jgi:GNAT superfamily N-acetyltransferase
MPRPARAKDRAALEALWLTVFTEDGPADVAAFWQSGFSPGQAFVHEEDGQILSMAFLLPAKRQIGKDVYPVGYLYAAATHPEHRGRGLFSGVMTALHAAARAKGLRGVILRPAEPSLEGFYARAGYRPAFFVREDDLSREEIAHKAASAAADMRILRTPTPFREEWLTAHGVDHVVMDDAAWRYTLSANEFWQGDGWSAVCAASGSRLLVREWLGDGDRLPAFYRALLDNRRFERVTIRRPADERRTVFGMALDFGGDLPPDRTLSPAPYMGLALD